MKKITKNNTQDDMSLELQELLPDAPEEGSEEYQKIIEHARKKVLEIMWKYNLTPTDMSEITGVDPAIFTLLKQDKTRLGLKSLVKISKAFKMPIEYFLDTKQRWDNKLLMLWQIIKKLPKDSLYEAYLYLRCLQLKSKMSDENLKSRVDEAVEKYIAKSYPIANPRKLTVVEIKNIMEKEKIGAAGFAKRIGVSRQTIYYILSGQVEISQETSDKIRLIYGYLLVAREAHIE
jgi:plasmid maintenance system antidote protein VapI